jgi:arylsulfatase A-like enzyme
MKEMQYCNRNVNLLDIYPTLIDLCNLPKKELDGKSIKPLLENPKKEWTPTLTTLGKGNHSVMSEKWHYVYMGKNGVEELYNLENDPMEWTNLSNNKSSEIEYVKNNLRTYMPVNNADELVRKLRDKSEGEDGDGSRNPDLTIKPKRVLSELK